MKLEVLYGKHVKFMKKRENIILVYRKYLSVQMFII